MKNNNKGIIAVLVVVIVALISLVVLLATGTVNFKSQVSNNEINFSKLAEISKSDYNFIKGVNNNEYSLNILSNGKIIINFNNYITNISNAKDIVLFGDNSDLAYILTTDGNIMKYDLSNIKNNIFEATKINEYSNIKSIITYMTRKKNAGGCNYLVAIDKDEKYYKLDSICH